MHAYAKSSGILQVVQEVKTLFTFYWRYKSLRDQGYKFVTYLTIFESEESTLLDIVIFVRGCVSKVGISSYSFSFFI